MARMCDVSLEEADPNPPHISINAAKFSKEVGFIGETKRGLSYISWLKRGGIIKKKTKS